MPEKIPMKTIFLKSFLENQLGMFTLLLNSRQMQTQLQVYIELRGEHPDRCLDNDIILSKCYF